MLWKKQENRKSSVNMGKLERLVDEGVKKWLVWETYVAATNMPDPDQQRLGLTLIRTYLRSMGKLSQAYVALSRLIGGRVEIQKAIRNAINPLGEMPYATDVFTAANLLLLGEDTKLDMEAVPQVEEIYEAINDYRQTRGYRKRTIKAYAKKNRCA